MKWRKLKTPYVLAADIGILVWFLSRLYTVGLPVQEQFSLTPQCEDIASRPRMEKASPLSAEEQTEEEPDLSQKASDVWEQAVKPPLGDFLQDPTVVNPGEGVSSGETGELIMPPPLEEGENGTNNDQGAGVDLSTEAPPEESMQGTSADNSGEGVIGGETQEMIEPPPPPDQGEFNPESDQAGTEPPAEPPTDEFLQDSIADNPGEGVINGDIGEMPLPPPPEEQAGDPSIQPPADAVTNPEVTPEAPPADTLPRQDPNDVGPFFGEEIIIPPDTDNPPFPE